MLWLQMLQKMKAKTVQQQLQRMQSVVQTVNHHLQIPLIGVNCLFVKKQLHSLKTLQKILFARLLSLLTAKIVQS